MPDSIDVSDLVSLRWLIGLGGAVVVGHFLAGFAMALDGYWKRFRDALHIGIVERAFFTVAVAFEVSAVGPAMIGWVAAKMAAGWNRNDEDGEESTKDRRFQALRGNLISMGMAVVGGLIANGTVSW